MLNWKLISLKLEEAISEAEAHLVKKSKKKKACTYSLAIAVYSLYLSPATPSSEVKNTLKSRIQDSEKSKR